MLETTTTGHAHFGSRAYRSMANPKDSTYRRVQGLSRGLAVLTALNDANGGGATPRELGERTKLNRTTVKRLLETLAEQGYVLPCSADGSYALAPQVLRLSRGLTEDASVLQYAGPVLQDLGERTGWSLRITTPNKDSMVVRATTHSNSTLAMEHSVGLRHTLPMLLTAAGRAYFAHCGSIERNGIVNLIQVRRDEQVSLAHNAKLLELIKKRVLQDGYAMNDGEWPERRLGAIALPIRRKGKPLACMSMLFSRSAVSKSNISGEFFDALRQGVDSVESHL